MTDKQIIIEMLNRANIPFEDLIERNVLQLITDSRCSKPGGYDNFCGEFHFDSDDMLDNMKFWE